jgi:hypothetical protein
MIMAYCTQHTGYVLVKNEEGHLQWRDFDSIKMTDVFISPTQYDFGDEYKSERQLPKRKIVWTPLNRRVSNEQIS